VSFLAPGYLWLLGLAAPVVLLYFFRQRQEERVVPTNFLWVQALQDTRTAAVFRRFLKSLLLLLQLLFLALAVLALAGATASLWSQGSARLVVAVLDRSASMGVKDGGEGRTRLDAAKAALGNAVDGLREGDRMMLIAVDERAEVLVPFTGEKERLLAAAAKVEVRDLGTDLGDAAVLLKSQGEAAAGRDLEVLVLSDGAFPDPGGLPGAKVSYVPFGEAKDNAGVADLRIVRGPAGAASLFVSVETFGGKDLKRTLSLHAGPDLKLVDAREAAAAPLGQAVVFFPLDSLEPGPLEVRLDGEDAFAADDRAWCVYRPDPPRRYAVYGAESRWLREPGTFRGGLEGSPLPVKDAAALRAAGPLDLVIYNGEVPEDPPPSRAAIYIHCVPPKGPAKVVGTMEYPPVLDWSRTHAVTRHAEFSDLLVVEALRLEGVPPGSVLVDSPKGPLLAFLESPDQQALVLTFDLDKSNLPLRLAFPLLLSNAMDHFFSERRPGDEEEFVRTGSPIERAVPKGGTMEVTPPAGPTAKVEAGADGRAVHRDTFRAGLYRLRTPAGPSVAAASLLRRGESDIGPRERVETGGIVHEARPEAVRANVLLRDPLLLLALAILLLEWMLWVRRK
jgi:Ca-activated chloride channel family protein